MIERIPIEKWGKDHWSLLAYIETCCVDQNGHFELTRIRVNPGTHPLLAVGMLSARKWGPVCNTVLNDNTLLYGHDDVDCLDDLEEAGMIEIYSLVNGIAGLTPLGIKVSAQLREHKIVGRNYKDFRIGCIA
jgi:hypothetical protein